MSISREELAVWVSAEGGVADFILGYCEYADRLPKDAPLEVTDAWRRLERIRPDVLIISAWLWQ